jgi:hypothetical protein
MNFSFLFESLVYFYDKSINSIWLKIESTFSANTSDLVIM